MEEKCTSALHTYPKGATGSYLTKNGFNMPLESRVIIPCIIITVSLIIMEK